MALVRKPAAHSSQNTPVRSACSRVNEGSSLGSSAAGGSPASETGCRGGNPAPPHKPQIDDLLTDEAKSADRSATQQGEADEQHHCGLNCRHESAGEGEATAD